MGGGGVGAASALFVCLLVCLFVCCFVVFCFVLSCFVLLCFVFCFLLVCLCVRVCFSFFLARHVGGRKGTRGLLFRVCFTAWDIPPSSSSPERGFQYPPCLVPMKDCYYEVGHPKLHRKNTKPEEGVAVNEPSQGRVREDLGSHGSLSFGFAVSKGSGLRV